MPTSLVTNNIAGNVKPSFASSVLAGLTVRANGEEKTKVLDMNGNMVDAEFPIPVAPVVLEWADGADNKLPAGKWAAYATVYASVSRYPFVENDTAIGGSLAPRGNPSTPSVIQVGAGGKGIQVLAAHIDRADIDQVWFFRSAFFASEAEARLAGEAGNLYFIGALDAAWTGSPATAEWRDENEIEGGDLVEVDNFGVPTFQHVIYADPYWWGWGNYPLSVRGTWSTAGILTLTDGSKWFNGRDGQYVRLENLISGGIGNNGLWLFKWLSPTTAQLVMSNGDVATLQSAGEGAIIIQGPPTTLYRSKARNPFSWGKTEVLANGDRIPEVYAFKIGGGLGTAIAQIPNLPYLLLSTEYPAGTFTLDLRLAGTTGFESSLRQISNFYSITSHFSQFAATKSDDTVVLWGWDAKNFCILECEGMSIRPISQPISKTLRHMTSTRFRQILAHGAYDARNRLNCMWLPTSNGDGLINLLIAQHAPTGQFFIHDEHDVLCSAQFQDGDTNLSKVYVGTETGLMGEAFAEGHSGNWIATGRSSGTIGAASGTAITRNDGLTFYLDRDGYVGNWCLITDANGESEQWARISGVAADTLTFDYIRPAIGGATDALNPIPDFGSKFYVGVIECKAVKYFDLGVPSDEKKLDEIWLTLDGVATSQFDANEHTTFLRYFRDRNAVAFAPKNDGRLNIPVKRAHHDDGSPTQNWFTQEPPTEHIRTFGIEIIDRGFGQWRFYNWTLKAK